MNHTYDSNHLYLTAEHASFGKQMQLFQLMGYLFPE